MNSGVTTLNPSTRVYIAGHQGLVGSALWRHFTDAGFENLIGRTSDALDLRDARATADFFRETRPEVVIAAAARCGGILANSTSPVEFISDNIRIQVNLLDNAVALGVSRFLFLGSSCIYPKHAAQPIREDALLGGHLEPTNEAYAVAKIAGVAHVAAIRRQYGLPYITAMPTNLYGPNDNFHSADSHVLAAMIRRFDEAQRTGVTSVTCWGTGSPRREFMHVDDFAKACHVLLDRYDDDTPINVGTGQDVSIAELATIVASATGFQGTVDWDPSKPDGAPRKLLDTHRLDQLGWKPVIPLEQGVRSTYDWFLAQREEPGC